MLELVEVLGVVVSAVFDVGVVLFVVSVVVGELSAVAVFVLTGAGAVGVVETGAVVTVPTGDMVVRVGKTKVEGWIIELVDKLGVSVAA